MMSICASLSFKHLMYSNSSILPYQEDGERKSLSELLDSYTHESYDNSDVSDDVNICVNTK